MAAATCSLRDRIKGIASRGLTRAAGALTRPALPWLSRREGFRTLPQRLLIAASPERADLIHVLGGGLVDDHLRVDRAVELYQRGFAPRMLLTGSEWRIDWAERNARRARDLGVPSSALLLDPVPRTTRAEAAVLRRIVIAEGIRTVLLVTEAFHAGRAVRVMERALRRTGARVRSCPAGSEGFPPDRWWEDPAERALLLGEAARLLLARASGGA